MRRFNFAVLLLVFILSFCIAATAPAEENSPVGPDTFAEILEYTHALHISRPDYNILLRGAIDGLIDSLCDPYTEYIPPSELDDFSSSLDGNYAGVGMMLRPAEKYPEVVETVENTPARNAGIKPGDLVIKVDGIDVASEPLGVVVQRIRGPEGTKVVLTIRRKGVEDFDIELVRASIRTPTVSCKMLKRDVGYIRISSFGNQTACEFDEKITELVEQGSKKIILDLRDNPGGILQAAVQICSNFIEGGRVVVSTVDRDGDRQEYRAEGNPTCRGMPVVVLVNHNSASAAEILAGALQDYGVATLIGERTYGKGTVQVVVPLRSGGALKITTAMYYTPKNRIIDGTGLCPDVQVLTPELQIAVAQNCLELQKKVKILLEAGKDEAYVNGIPVRLNQAVMQREGAVYLPVRFIFEALGCRVDWQEDSRSIKITGSDMEVSIYTGEGRIAVNGRDLAAAAPTLFEGGSVFIPAAVFSSLDINVKINGNNITVEK